ncbi:MAG: hypothetical protein BGO01_17215 [Armatimonadetes bacterium 55-13]|nr:TlpA family protein disulfide reductase [Armatimonadota bacterium]OJU63894.1 MAG: hypothetical protein BGO01_17215 [Armatimonadetes bacterium 55-13]
MKRLTKVAAVLTASALTLAAFARSGPYVTIGDPAPAFKPAKWLKGTPVKQFEKGKTYVVEFWATWCNPCKENIPHLTELAKKYAGKVSIIGVDIWESAKGGEGDHMPKVEAFVKEQGKKMDYLVAADGAKNQIADAWMKAAGEGGIPCSFIINGEGKVAWIGHPAKMEETLVQVLDGTYNLAAAREKREYEYSIKRPIDEAMNGKKYAELVKLIDAAIEKKPELAYPLTYNKLVGLYHSNLEEGKAYSTKVLLDSQNAIGAFQMMSSIFAVYDDLSKEAYQYGIGLIDDAIKQDLGVFMFTAMKAATYFNMGDKAQAIKFAEESVALAEKDQYATPEQMTLLKKNLAKFKAAK